MSVMAKVNRAALLSDALAKDNRFDAG